MKNEKFIHQETGLTFILTQIPNTDFWADKDGDLYLATHGTCERISGERALMALLARKTPQPIVRITCHDKSIPAHYRQSNDDVLNNLWNEK